MEKITYTIPFFAMEHFETELAKINKKAEKYGLAQITYEVVLHEEKQITTGEKVPCKVIEINQPEEIRINGWKIVGKLEQNAGEEFIIHQFGEAIPEEVKAIRTCQHCDTNRNRKYYYILQHENGEYKTVGKACLKEFIGDDSAERLAFNLQKLYFYIEENAFDPEMDYFTGGSFTPFYPVKKVVALSLYSIKTLGGYRGSGYFGLNTRTHVENMVWGTQKEDFNEREEALNTITEAEVEECIKAVMESEDVNNQFIQNLQIIIKEEYVKPNLFGYAVAIPTVLERQNWKSKEEKKEEEAQVSNYVGEVGEVLETTVKFDREIAFDGFYGTTFMYFFKDENGNVIVWKTTSARDFDEEESYMVKGRVKEHNEYRDTKQTFLNRPKFTEVG